MPSHSHTISRSQWANGSLDTIQHRANGKGEATHRCYPDTGAAGGSSSHTHSLSGAATIALNVKYTDVIICSKN